MTSRKVPRRSPIQLRSISTMTDVTFCHMQPGLPAKHPINAPMQSERSGEQMPNAAVVPVHLAKSDQRN